MTDARKAFRDRHLTDAGMSAAQHRTRDLDRLPASYANFYIANSVVLAPVFGHANDSRPSNASKLFPTRSRSDQLRTTRLGHGHDPLRHATTATDNDRVHRC
jgi:hypothetical protein